jgi:cysteine-rich repeat protein
MLHQAPVVRIAGILRGGSALSFFALVAASGCVDEVGGDGYEPPPPVVANGGTVVGMGGADAGSAGDNGVTTAGKGGSGGKAGSGGKGGRGGGAGRGGTGVIDEGGAGGEPPSGPVCGNGVIEAGEDCDDGNTKGFDACPPSCNAACQTCEQTYCKNVRSMEAGPHDWVGPNTTAQIPLDPLTACTEIVGDASGGPAQGEPRAELCMAMVDCIRREKCWQIFPDDLYREEDGLPVPNASVYAFMHCFCARDVRESSYIKNCQVSAPEDSTVPEAPDAPPHYIEGKCAREIWEASERDNQGLVWNSLTNKASPLGIANIVYNACDRRLCLEECLPTESVGVVAQISADVPAAANDAGDSQLGALIADSQRQAGNTDFAFINVESVTPPDFGPSGLIFAATPGRAADADGRVLESELRHVLFGMDVSVGNSNVPNSGFRLMTMQLTGQQVYDVLNVLPATVFVSGLTYTWDNSLPLGSRVTEILKDGVALDKTATYSATVNNVFAENLASRLTPKVAVVATDKQPLAALISYLKSLPQPVAPPVLNRVIRVN